LIGVFRCYGTKSVFFGQAKKYAVLKNKVSRLKNLTEHTGIIDIKQ
jgi:hypothetical protein